MGLLDICMYLSSFFWAGGLLLVLICSEPASLGPYGGGGICWGFSLCTLICLCLLAYKLALRASGSTISQAFLSPQATFMRALLLTPLGRLLMLL